MKDCARQGPTLPHRPCHQHLFPRLKHRMMSYPDHIKPLWGTIIQLPFKWHLVQCSAPSIPTGCLQNQFVEVPRSPLVTCFPEKVTLSPQKTNSCCSRSTVPFGDLPVVLQLVFPLNGSTVYLGTHFSLIGIILISLSCFTELDLTDADHGHTVILAPIQTLTASPHDLLPLD